MTERLYLGVCDKIVPGLLIGALSFGHLAGTVCPCRADAHQGSAMLKNQKSVKSLHKDW